MAKGSIGSVSAGKRKKLSIQDDEYLYDKSGNKYSRIALKALLLAVLNFNLIQ